MIMRMIILFLLCLTVFYNCNVFENNNKKFSDPKDTVTERQVSKDTSATISFFENCNKLVQRSWVQTLQGLPSANKDSINNLCVADCYDCKNTYEVLFLYKDDIKKRNQISSADLLDSLHKGCGDIFGAFKCFSFVIPMRDPEKQDDVHAMNIDFPNTVKVYKRITLDNWTYKGSVTVKSFEEYSKLQFLTVYDLN